MSTLGMFAAAVDRDARRQLVLGQVGGAGDVDGIDFVEVITNRRGRPGFVAGAPAQRTLMVHLLKRPVPVDWRAERARILGGVRPDAGLNPVGVTWAYPAALLVEGGPPLPGVAPADRRLVTGALLAETERPLVFVVRTTSAGDFSGYLLQLRDTSGTKAPDGFDPVLAESPFDFKVDCPTVLDCATSDAPAIPDPSGPALDYLARDYPALRTRLIDWLGTRLPEWRDRNPADPGITVAELYAYLGDRLSYRQDAIGAEAYLGTARRRASVRRHARLLDYRVHEGCAARTWLALTTTAAFRWPAGSGVADVVPANLGRPPTPLDAHEAGAVVMETGAPVRLEPARNALPLYAWGDADHWLAPGATAAFVAGPAGLLHAGDVVILADRPAHGDVHDGDPTTRRAVRLAADPVAHADPTTVPPTSVLELTWTVADALVAPLRVSEPGGTGGPVVRAVALANVVLADHGASVEPEALVPGQVPPTGTYAPRVGRTGLSFTDPLPPDRPVGDSADAVGMVLPDPARARPALELDDGQRTWTPVLDLLASGRFDAHLVVEPEADRVARIRFGDGTTGRRPTRGAQVVAWYRLGGGLRGNVGPDRLTKLLAAPGGAATIPSGATVTAWNPLPASGGADPQLLEEVKALAPQAFRTQLRAVTSPDYATVAMADADVQRAVARRRWTGSWYAQEVTVDLVAGAERTQPTEFARIAGALDVRRMAGVDVELAEPVFVPLDLRLVGCVQPGQVRAHVLSALTEALSGRRFFNPDRFTFGQPLYLSEVVGAAMAVPGLAWVEVTRFGRTGAPPVTGSVLVMGPREVLRCDSDPSNPEAGRVEIVLRGGV